MAFRTSQPQSERSNGEVLENLLFGCSLIAALIFAVLGITRSVWLDEAFSINLAALDPIGILEGLKSDGHPPLYFLLLAGWTRVFGESEIAVRALSGLLYLLSVAGTYALARAVLEDRRAARIAAILYLTSKIAVAHAQTARMYSLLGCLVVLTTLFYVRAFFLDHPRPSDRWLYTLCVLLGTFTHFWFAFCLFAQLVGWWFLSERRRGYLLDTTVACTPFALFWVPILFKYQVYNGVSDWMARQSFGPSRFFATFADFYGESWLGGLVWLGVALLLVFGWKNWRPTFAGLGRFVQIGAFLRQPRILLFAILPTLSLAAPLLISQLRPIYRTGSYTIIALAPTVILLAALLHRFADQRLAQVFLAGLLISALTVFTWLRTRAEECSDRQAAEIVLEQAKATDQVLFTSLSRAAVEYYFRRSETGQNLALASFPSEIDAHPGWRSPSDQGSRRRALDLEAARYDQTLRQDLQTGDRLWLFYGADTEISNMLKRRMDQWLKPTGEFACDSGFYSTILLYERTPRTTLDHP